MNFPLSALSVLIFVPGVLLSLLGLQRHQASLARIPDKNVEEDEEFEDFSRKLLSNFQKKVSLECAFFLLHTMQAPQSSVFFNIIPCVCVCERERVCV